MTAVASDWRVGYERLCATLVEQYRAIPAGAPPSDYTGMNIYYRSIQQRESDVLTIHD